MATPIEKPSAFTNATRSTRSGIKNFSRRFERKPKALNSTGIANLPPALGTHGGDYVAPSQAQGADGADDGHEDDDEEELDGTTATSNSRMSTSTASSMPNIRAPAVRKRRFLRIFASSKNFKLPDLPWLCGTWHITHSSMPVWRAARNVKVTYTRMTSAGRLDDVIQYTPLGDTNGRVERIHGVDSLKSDGSYAWKGKGKLTTGAIASSRWEVLGWGGGGSKAAMQGDPERNEQWLITYFAKTMFSPAGVSICSRGRNGLTPRTMRKLIKGLRKVDKTMLDERRGGDLVDGKGDFGRMLDGMIPIPQDDAEVGIVQGQLPERH